MPELEINRKQAVSGILQEFSEMYSGCLVTEMERSIARMQQAKLLKVTKDAVSC